jgi:hypothetical protein
MVGLCLPEGDPPLRPVHPAAPDRHLCSPPLASPNMSKAVPLMVGTMTVSVWSHSFE